MSARLLLLGAVSVLVPATVCAQADDYPLWDQRGTACAGDSGVCANNCGVFQCDCGGWVGGFEFVFVRPHFQSNPAFTVVDADGVSFESFTQQEFDYDFALSPRLWFGYGGDGIGVQARYWQFDQAAATQTASPSASGFGRIIHPEFGFVDITTPIPSDTFTARSGLDAYTIDLEVTKLTDFRCWSLLASAGVRYAEVDQDYFAELRDNAGILVGAIDHRQGIHGFGPTVALETSLPIGGGLGFFGGARGSVLFGQGSSTLQAGEDLDLLTPFFTTSTTRRDDVLAIAETRVGINWQSQDARLFAHGAFEGQLWSGAGNASSEQGDLAFLGLSFGMGIHR